MARKPRDFDAELQALMEKAKLIKSRRTVQLGELVQATSADTLSMEVLAGALLDAVEQAKSHPDDAARWAARGHAFFQSWGRRKGKSAAPNGAGEPAGGAASHGGTPPAPGRAAG